MKKNDRSFRTVMALFICFVSVLLAIAPAVSYIAGTPDSLMSYATDSENAAEDAKGTDAAEGTGGAKAADEEKAPAETPAETAKEDTEKETPKEEAVTDDTGSSEDNGYPAVELSQTVGGVEIGLSAGKGVFPEGVTLSASRVNGTELKKVDKALKAERGDASSVDSSYTFDIKVLDAEGEEVQPADGKDVSLSFAAKKVADKNLSTRVYHIEDGKKELDATELKVSTNGDTATVETDGFSYYTVEFTYGDKQYVLEGDGVVKLDDLLKEIGIKGEVKGTKVSDPELFDVILGTKKGVRYINHFRNGKVSKVPANDSKGTIRYVVSYKAFETEEWMDVLMEDGTKYHVIVTDAITGNDTNHDEIDGVSQGVGQDFAENIPVATIWIDDSIIAADVASRHVGNHQNWSLDFIPGELMDPNNTEKYHRGFQVESFDTDQKGSAQYIGNHFIIFDSNQETLNGTTPATVKASGKNVYQSYNKFEGVVGTYKYSNAAKYTDSSGQEKDADVYIEYSDPMISIQTPTDTTSAAGVPSWNNVKVGLFAANMITNGKDKDNGQRYALSIKVRPYVKDSSTGELVKGQFYFPAVHINVDRTSNNNFKQFYASNPELSNYEESLHSYSEQMEFSGGMETNKYGHKLYIPGGQGDSYNYIPYIDYSEENGKYVVYPSDGNSKLAQNDVVEWPVGSGNKVVAGYSFYFGFLTLVNNGDFAIKAYTSSSGGCSGTEMYILSGTKFNYRLRHSTETVGGSPQDGGNIQTTHYGNHNGLLNDGGEILEPSIKATSSGQTVVYTFKPKEGYNIRNVYIWNDDGQGFPPVEDMKTRGKEIRQGDGSNNTYEAFDDDGDGVPDRYTYSFHGIHSDNAIHVVWDKPQLEIKKTTAGSGRNTNDKFRFKIKAVPDEGASGNPVNFKNTGHTDLDARFTDMGDSWYSFELSAGETLQIPSDVIPLGYKWTVEEIGYERGGKTEYGSINDGWIPPETDKRSRTGKFTDTKKYFFEEFTNKRVKPDPEEGTTLTVKKVWDDEPALRPNKLTMYIRKEPAVGIDPQEFREAIVNLVPAGAVTSIKYGTSNSYNEARENGGIKTVAAKSGYGKGEVYFWKDGTDVYFYSESMVYLIGSAKNMFGDSANSGTDSFHSLKDISGLSHVHTEFVTDMTGMFFDCYSITDLSPLAKWNTANVTSMSKMLGCQNPKDKPMMYTSVEALRNWKVQNVTSMRWMFRGAAGLSDLEPLRDWDVGRNTDFCQAFYRTNAGNSNNKSYLENWNVQSVGNSSGNIIGDFNEMFRYSSNGSTPGASNLPDWSRNTQYPRTGEWDDGTYKPTGGPKTQPGEYGKNVVGDTFTNRQRVTLSQTAHDETTEDGKTVWVYTFDVPDDAAEWDVYEVIPNAYDGLYSVSASYDNKKSGDASITSPDTPGVGKQNDPYKGAEPGSTTTITNTSIKHKLTVKKDIPTDEPITTLTDEQKTFEFTIKLSAGGRPYDFNDTAQYEEMHKHGKIYRVKAGEYKLKIIGRGSEEFLFPAGIQYEVTETGIPSGEGVSWALLSSDHTSGTLDQDREASFLNSKDGHMRVIKTWKGDSYNGTVFETRPTKADALGVKVTTNKPKTYDPHSSYMDNEANTWLYKFVFDGASEEVTNVNEETPPQYYDSTITESDGIYQITNTLKTNDLTIEKATMDNEKGEFEFEVKFWVDSSTENRHPVKIGHTQIFNVGTEQDPKYEGEFVIEDGITIDDMDVSGIFELIYDNETGYKLEGENFHAEGEPPTLLQLQALMEVMKDTTSGEEDGQYGRLHKADRKSSVPKTQLKLIDFGLKWYDQDTELVYVEQSQQVVESMFNNGRRIDWYIIPTPGEGGDEDKPINISIPYGLRATENEDGPAQLPSGVTGDHETGTYHFTLKNGGQIRFRHLPAGVKYDITEYYKDGWKLIKQEQDHGQLYRDTTSRFNNEIKKGRLVISKATEYDEPGTFTFHAAFGRPLDTSKVSGTTVTPVYPGGGSAVTTDVDNVTEHEDSIVYEVGSDTYTLDNSSVKIGDSYADILNVDYPNSFTLKKVSDGKTYSLKYDFIPTLDEETGEKTYKMSVTSATYEFRLNNGGKAIFAGIPFGTSYDVEEISIPDKWELSSLTNDTNGNMKADGYMNVGVVSPVSEAAADTLSYTFTNKRTGKDVTTEYRTITRYITYTEYTVDGKKVADTVSQPLKIQRTKTVDYDAEPNDTFNLFSIKAAESDSPKITYSKWEIVEGSAGAVTSSDYPGWTPDIKVVPEWVFNQDDPQDEWVHVIYLPDGGGSGRRGSGTNTGDSNNVVLWLGLFAAACAALLGGIVYKKRKDKTGK